MNTSHDFDALVATVNENYSSSQQKVTNSTQSSIWTLLKKGFSSWFSSMTLSPRKVSPDIQQVLSSFYGLPPDHGLTPRQRDALMLASDIARVKDKISGEEVDEPTKQEMEKAATFLYEIFKRRFYQDRVF